MSDDPSSMPDANAVQLVFRNLRARIVSGRLGGGEILVEQDLARDLGVSRTPVREALRLLASQGLVDLEHRRRARVAAIGAQDIEEGYDVRFALEPLAASKAATRATGPAVQKIVAAQERLDVLAGAWGPDAMGDFVHWNAEFHLAIIAAAASVWLSKAVKPVIDLPIAPVSHLHALTADELDLALRQHRDIIAAIRDRDADLAAASMRVHLITTHRSVGRRSGPAGP